MTQYPFLLIDRDGTIVYEPEDEQVDSLDKLRFLPGVFTALKQLSDAGYRLVMVSNQDGLGSSAFPRQAYQVPHDWIIELLASQGIHFQQIRICPHWPDDGCDCRKPRTGLVHDYLTSQIIDRGDSFVIGDRQTDLQFADNMGIEGLQIGQGALCDWQRVAHYILNRPRQAEVKRQTKETRISVWLDLDSSDTIKVATGIGFFDHMLEQVAKHAGISAVIEARGDLETGDHHTVEDTALVLGQALAEALGDKRGIGRYGFVVPMDETQAQVALDLSGRPFSSFHAQLPDITIGGLSAEMVPHFFRSLAEAMGATIHISVSGSNAHHQIEAAFKCFARALSQAVSRQGFQTPSTKGVL